jgi:hypothetical protein
VAAHTFGAEGTDGRAPATKVREDQERGAPSRRHRVRGLWRARAEYPKRRDAPSPGSLPRRRRCGDPGHVAAADV